MVRREVLAAALVVMLLQFRGPAAIAQQAPSPPATQESAQGETPRADAVEAAAAVTKITSVQVGLRELSPWSMFVSASPIVQAVMVGLAFASLVTWTIFIGKFIELFFARRRLARALRSTREARTLSEAMAAVASDRSVLRTFVVTAANEARLSSDLHNDDGIKERAASSFAEIARTEARRIRIGMGVLATIGATSPFVGLFGTVWGIMTSFIGISKSQTTNLAVVAPGIAEALLATAVGLFAAIPAVIIYNHFSRVTKGYLELVGGAAGTAGRQLSRELDRRHAPMLRSAAE